MNIIINSSLMIPIYEQIVDQIKTLIRNGELKENDCLPSVRTLSRELKITKSEAQKYSMIIKSLEPRPSRGFYTGEDYKYIIPDAEIRKVGENLEIIININA